MGLKSHNVASGQFFWGMYMSETCGNRELRWNAVLQLSLLVTASLACSAGALVEMTVMGVQLFRFEGQLIWSRHMLWAGAQPELWAQLAASWLLAGQTSPQSQAYWEVQHRDTGVWISARLQLGVLAGVQGWPLRPPNRAFSSDIPETQRGTKTKFPRGKGNDNFFLDALLFHSDVLNAWNRLEAALWPQSMFWEIKSHDIQMTLWHIWA